MDMNEIELDTMFNNMVAEVEGGRVVRRIMKAWDEIAVMQLVEKKDGSLWWVDALPNGELITLPVRDVDGRFAEWL